MARRGLPARGLALALALVASFITLHQSAASLAGCNNLVDQYKALHAKEAVPYNGTNMVYFLHVPRTAGRTFHSCFLRTAFPASKRCPKAYDHLRINMDIPHCSLLSSHDDFSVLSKLPPEVSVVHQFRDPVDRFLSAYEFAVEVGSRELKKPPNFSKNPNKVATSDVWPWSHLVPFFAADIKARRAQLAAHGAGGGGHLTAHGGGGGDDDDVWQQLVDDNGQPYYYNKRQNLSKFNLTDEELRSVVKPLDPYDNPLYMPLREFAHHPIAADLLHDGGFFQVMGLTNYSHWGSANEMRHCMQAHPDVEAAMLGVAQRRMRTFTHVGTTDRLYESVSAAAAAIGRPLSGPAYAGGENKEADVERRRRRDGGYGYGDGDAVPHVDGVPTDVVRARLAERKNLRDLHKAVRDKRAAMTAAQKKLYGAVNSAAKPQPAALEALKKAAAERRAELRTAQEALHAAMASAKGSLVDVAQVDGSNGSGGGGGGGGGGDDNSYDDGEDKGTDGARRRSSQRRRGRLLMEAAAGNDDGGEDAAAASGGGGDATDAQQFEPLGPSFRKCANRAQARSAQRRKTSLAALQVPDGRSPVFSKAARKKIPQELIDYIRSQNRLDTELHGLALDLLEASIERYKKDGRWEELPKERGSEEAGGGGDGGGGGSSGGGATRRRGKRGQRHSIFDRRGRGADEFRRRRHLSTHSDRDQML